jgi:hypothetical protein
MRNYEEDVDESMTDIFKKENIKDYKGIYFKEKESQRYYEGNAHFSYKELIKLLDLHKATLQQERKEPENLVAIEPYKPTNKTESSKSIKEIEIVTINVISLLK